jgi:hypothetical protein
VGFNIERVFFIFEIVSFKFEIVSFKLEMACFKLEIGFSGSTPSFGALSQGLGTRLNW